MTWQWIGLTIFSLTLLPAGLAIATGRLPARLPARRRPPRAYGWAVLALYATAPLNAIPRLTGAAPRVSLALTSVAGIVAVAGCLLAALASLRRAGDGTP
ncbi:hypothetical protein ACIRUY_17580 [Streptomyces erythrochromogenes]|uniref:hypothetical protein n=1 Tax=Streptomyces erythrochromogenes TaxID=285574 RepID=UPI00380E5777